MRSLRLRFYRVPLVAGFALCAWPGAIVHAQESYTLPDGRAGATYEFQIRTEGGMPPMKWKLAGGDVPPGLELEGGTGTLRGMPTIPRAEPYRFAVEVSDSSTPPMTAAQWFSLRVNAAPLRIVLRTPALRIVPPDVGTQAAAGNHPDRQGGPDAEAKPPVQPPHDGAKGATNPSSATPPALARAAQLPANPIGATTPPPAAPAGGNPSQAATPTFSPAPGTYSTTQSVTLADATTGATIYYTTDGSTPTTASTLYSEPITVSSTTTIKAIATASGFSTSAVASGTYTSTGPAYLRAIVGLDISGASSLPSQQKFFLEFNLNAPLRLFSWKRNSIAQTPPLNRLLWVWLNPRFTALPSEAVTSLNGLAQGSFSLSNLVSGNTNRIVQGFEFLGGIEFHLVHPRRGIPVPFGGKVGQVRISPTLVLAGGAITPFSVPDKAQQEFNFTPTVLTQLQQNGLGTGANVCMTPGATNCQSVIAFLSPNRDRFFRQYYAGFRLKSYYFSTGTGAKSDTGPCDGRRADDPCDLFPGIFDAMVGQNESVTGGKLRGYVVRLEGFYPLPFAPEFHLFGTAWMRVARPKITNPVVLDFASPALPLTDPKVFLQVLPQADRDFYRFGVGLDLVPFIRKIQKK